MKDNIFDDIMLQRNWESRAINAENPTGGKGVGGTASSILGASRKGSPCLKDIKSGETVTLANIEGIGIIRHIWITVDSKTSDAERFILRDIILRMYWDDEKYPSVEVPLGDFFCCGFGQECNLVSYPIVVAPLRGFNSYFSMPFRKNARLEITSEHANVIPAFFYQIDYTLVDSLPAEVMYFHAQWRRESLTHKKKDYVLVDGIKGKGTYIGTYIALSTLQRYWWGEGEMKFYLDGDTEYPTICGTGMEDYFGGSWSFASQDNGKTVENTYCSPFFGYPFQSRQDSVTNPYHNDDVPPMRGFYRWHLPDPIYFHSDLRVTVQQIGVSHGGLFERQDDLSSTAYWYQTHPHMPFPALPAKLDRWPR